MPFTGAIGPASVSSDTVNLVNLVNLGDTLSSAGFGQRVGINPVSRDAAAKTLVFESDELLQEHSPYLRVVTTGVKDATGDPIEASAWDPCRSCCRCRRR